MYTAGCVIIDGAVESDLLAISRVSKQYEDSSSFGQKKLERNSCISLTSSVVLVIYLDEQLYIFDKQCNTDHLFL